MEAGLFSEGGSLGDSKHVLTESGGTGSGF